MKQSITTLVEEAFKDPKKISVSHIQELVSDSVRMFVQMQADLSSSDPEVREKARVCAEEMRKELEAQANRVLEKSGLSKEELQAISEDAKNFSPEEWDALSSARERFAEFRAEKLPPPDEGSKKRAKKSSKTWLVG